MQRPHQPDPDRQKHLGASGGRHIVQVNDRYSVGPVFQNGRDLASLNKVELLPWDGWGLIDREDKDLSADDLALLDRVAVLTVDDNRVFVEMRTLYENDARLCVPSVIKSYSASGVQTIDLAGLT